MLLAVLLPGSHSQEHTAIFYRCSRKRVRYASKSQRNATQKYLSPCVRSPFKCNGLTKELWFGTVCAITVLLVAIGIRMPIKIFQVDKRREYQKAGPFDLIRLLPVPGNNPLFLPKFIIEIVVYGIANCEIVRLSGQSGAAKSSLIEALCLVPENFNSICGAIGFPRKPLKAYPIDMASFKTAGELCLHGGLEDATTGYRESGLVNPLHS